MMLDQGYKEFRLESLVVIICLSKLRYWIKIDP
jgi:hypothetical protein